MVKTTRRVTYLHRTGSRPHYGLMSESVYDLWNASVRNSDFIVQEVNALL